MPEENKGNIFNYLKEVLTNSGLSSRLLGLCLNIHKGTLSNWNSNLTQPNLEDIDKIASIIEIDNFDLIKNSKRKTTGLIDAINIEYRRLTKDLNLPLYIEEEKDGKTKKIYNPILQKSIWDFIENYRTINRHKEEESIKEFNKPYTELTQDELNEITVFICKEPSSNELLNFEYLVVNTSLNEQKFIARFSRKEDAKIFAELVLQGYFKDNKMKIVKD
ncbi:hypothetical protein KO02_22275 [Sphingobacterium sp. ML3W]|uniref:helix-turn-helix domain-containing protein n=1 Tax=Sphingobacterium sp. ML3W TaxID=1538644 RepID=UPI0004F824C2|nr:helix-turn-helix transcriptional regulator [Sphingobacterium sp. ML3W]AIM39105.1 hypothetical protein KO02_22275 [Sphingobacterium sp. ML3W]